MKTIYLKQFIVNFYYLFHHQWMTILQRLLVKGIDVYLQMLLHLIFQENIYQIPIIKH